MRGFRIATLIAIVCVSCAIYDVLSREVKQPSYEHVYRSVRESENYEYLIENKEWKSK